MLKLVLTCLVILVANVNVYAEMLTIEQLDFELDKIFAESELPGLSLVVVNDEEVLFQKSFGYANLELEKRYTNSTVHNIGSVSKTLIAVALMKAQELGKLNLDDPINQYLPFQVHHPKYPDIPITLRHLSFHVSGIKDGNVYDRAYVISDTDQDFSQLPRFIRKYISKYKKNEHMSSAKFLENVLSTKGQWYSKRNFIRHPPGTKYHYSNIGAALAAYVVEQAVGVSFKEFTQKYIFDTLDMTQTRWDTNLLNSNDVAQRYFDKSNPVPDYYLITWADGGLITSTTDFGKYLIEMTKGTNHDGGILSLASYQEMFKREEFKGGSSGVFWGVSESGLLNLAGSDPGVLTVTAINPTEGVAYFLMTNISVDQKRSLRKYLQRLWDSVTEYQWN